MHAASQKRCRAGSRRRPFRASAPLRSLPGQFPNGFLTRHPLTPPMRNLTRLAVPVLVSLLAPAALAQIVPGNLVVLRVGTGAAALSSTATASFLEQFTATGLPVSTLPMPIAASGPNRACTNSGSATSEGFVTQSIDGRYLTVCGYDAAPGVAGIAATAAATTNRVIARIDLAGTIDTSTALTDGYTASNIRSAVSIDGSSFWASGASGTLGLGGMRYATYGATTSTQLTGINNTRVGAIFGGQLYCSSASGSLHGISTVGVGTPTVNGSTITILPGFSIVSGPSGYDFFIADANTVYVADDRTSGLGGIQKWTLSAGTWTLQYTLAVTATSGCRGLSGYVDGGVTTLFATTTQTNANLLVSVTDSGPGSAFTTLATAATNTAFRGVRWVRTPSSVVHSGTACATNTGIPTIGTANGDPVLGNTAFQITAANVPVPTFVMFSLRVGASAPFGLPVPGTPACVAVYVLPDVLLAELSGPGGTAATALGIPNVQALTGAVLSAQAFPFDLTMTGFSLAIGSTDALDITIGN